MGHPTDETDENMSDLVILDGDKIEQEYNSLVMVTEPKAEVIRLPLVDIYLVESYKAYNYANTDHDVDKKAA
jgi:hypothetical protein